VLFSLRARSSETLARLSRQVDTLICRSDGDQTRATRLALTLVVQNRPKGLYAAPTDVFALYAVAPCRRVIYS
jgi:hypothetical protein